MMTHDEEIASVRDRQMALIKLLPTEDALYVLQHAPLDPDDAHEHLGDILQRRVLIEDRRRNHREHD